MKYTQQLQNRFCKMIGTSCTRNGQAKDVTWHMQSSTNINYSTWDLSRFLVTCCKWSVMEFTVHFLPHKKNIFHANNLNTKYWCVHTKTSFIITGHNEGTVSPKQLRSCTLLYHHFMYKQASWCLTSYRCEHLGIYKLYIYIFLHYVHLIMYVHGTWLMNIGW